MEGDKLLTRGKRKASAIMHWLSSYLFGYKIKLL